MENLSSHADVQLVPPPERPNSISDAELLRHFATPQIVQYFALKMPTVESNTLTLWTAELLKYLILVQYSPGRILFGKEIDDLWHFWILQTREYARLCEILPGGFFRHHSSNDYKDTHSHPEMPLDEAIERVLSFFISYYANFGPITAKRLGCWPPLRVVMDEAGWNVEELNDFLKDRATGSLASRSASEPSQ